MSAPIVSVESDGELSAIVDVPRPGLGRLTVFAGVAGLLAGLVAWLAGEQTLNLFQPQISDVFMRGVVVQRVGVEDQVAADSKNAITAYCLLGASLGLALGLAAGLARRATGDAIRAGGGGLVLGAVFAWAAAALVLPVYFHQQEIAPVELSQDLLLPLLVHVGCWAGVGLGGGLAWGIGLGAASDERDSRRARAAIGGLIGAILGAFAYEVIGGIGFPSSRSGEPISATMTTRCLARVTVALGAALSAAVLTESKSKRVTRSTQVLASSAAAQPDRA